MKPLLVGRQNQKQHEKLNSNKSFPWEIKFGNMEKKFEIDQSMLKFTRQELFREFSKIFKYVLKSSPYDSSKINSQQGSNCLLNI